MPTESPRPVRATVQAGTYTYGAAATVVIDGSSTPVTVQPYLSYQPSAGDRLLVQTVNNVLEVIQFLGTAIPVATDPLAALIAGSGQAFVAGETYTGGAYTLVPSVPAGINLVVGIVWFDLTPNVGNLGNGNYYVYTHGIAGYSGDWTQVTNPATLALCAGLNTSQSPVGNGTFVLYVDPLAQSISAASSVFGPVTDPALPSSVLTSVGTLGSSISTGGALTVLPSTSTAIALAQGQALFVVSGSNNQEWDVAGSGAPAGSTSIPVVSQTPNFNYPGTATITTGFRAGDIIYRLDNTGSNGHWYVYTPGPSGYTGTWADWSQITASSTVVLCESLSVASGAPADALNKSLGKLAADITADNHTALLQDLQTAFSACISDVIAQIGLPSNVAGIDSFETALDSVGIATPTLLYASSTDAVAGQVLGNLALQIMAINTTTDAQTLFNVTDSSWTGTGSKIQAANFLATYQAGRFGT